MNGVYFGSSTLLCNRGNDLSSKKPTLNKTNYTFSIHIMYLKYTSLGILQVYYVYSFSIHMMYTFCISNLEHLEVYKKYTLQKKHILIVYTFCTQKTPQEVYFLYTYTLSILFVKLRFPQCCWHQSMHFVYLLYNMGQFYTGQTQMSL